jgi:uncharacterized Zn finger protein
MARYWDDYGFFPASRPREAKGGIRAHSKRGAFGESWWARRWVSVLEGFDLGARLHRGRSYARRGQVLDVAIGRGLVESRVQGSRPAPYKVSIKVKTLSGPQWKRAAAALNREARFAAKLLALEMPEDVEKAFESAGLSLFPERRKDLTTECSCPDWSNPCKHIAAIYYLLGEEFDRDPFLIFKLRGLEREELTGLLGAAPAEGASQRPGAPPEEEGEAPAEPLRPEIGAFWAGGELPADPFGEVAIPLAGAALVRRLGRFPFWRGTTSLIEAIEPVYADASPRGLDAFLGAGDRHDALEHGRVSARLEVAGSASNKRPGGASSVS